MVKDWTKMYKKYKGSWVALAEDEETIIATSKNAREALEKAQKKGFNDPILTRVPKKLTTYAGYGV
jgi:hypothetical protein